MILLRDNSKLTKEKFTNNEVNMITNNVNLRNKRYNHMTWFT